MTESQSGSKQADEGAYPQSLVSFNPEPRPGYQANGKTTFHRNGQNTVDSNNPVDILGSSNIRNASYSKTHSQPSSDLAKAGDRANSQNNSPSSHSHRRRHERSHNRRDRNYNRLQVQLPPQRRYDYQALSHNSNSYNPTDPRNTQTLGLSYAAGRRPHVISALSPEGHRRYQYAQQRRTELHPPVYPYQSNPSPYINPYAKQNNAYSNPYSNGASYLNNQQHLQSNPLNDQIPLSLPNSNMNVIRNLDSPGDYSWRLSGYTECSQTCGGGKSPFFFSFDHGNT